MKKQKKTTKTKKVKKTTEKKSESKKKSVAKKEPINKKDSANKKKPANKKDIKKIILISLGVIGAGLFFGAATLAYITSTLPPVKEINNQVASESTKIYDRTGEVILYEIHGSQKRTTVPLEEIPEYVKNATISIEDANFYENPAFDWRGIMRAVWVNTIRGGTYQGGSTITQQLAKNIFLTPERTIIRKLKELVLAWNLEKFYSKDEILELYLNQVPYGSNVYGVEEASQFYFGKSVVDIGLNESAMLAALTKAPSYYSPWGENFDKLVDRKNVVLQRMYELGYISEKDMLAAKSSELNIADRFMSDIKAPHFSMFIQEYLNKKYGEAFVRSAGLEVITTLDWELEQIAEEAVKNGAARNSKLYKGENAALVAADPKTGQILAMVGSADYFNSEKEGNFNVAVQGLRQPGSAFKPFAYLTAFQKGFSPETIVWDTSTEFNTGGNIANSYRPGNFDEKFIGPVHLKNALAESINIPAVKTLYLAGIEDTIKNAEAFGITTLKDRNRFGLSLVLGGGEVTLNELVNAYGVFATEGTRHEPAYILKITDRKGNVIEEYRDRNEKVVNAQYPRLINEILSDPNLRAPLFSSSLSLTKVPGYQIALKTGTTNNYIDAWTLGYTPNLVAGVWVGNNRREPLQKSGGSVLAAVPIWHEFFSEAIKNYEPELFTKPQPVTSNIPIVRGELEKGGAHSILYYLNKTNDPQFNNWEDGVTKWLETHTVDYSKFTNGVASEKTVLITITSPENGKVIDDDFKLSFTVKSEEPPSRFEIYLNNGLIDESTSDELPSEFEYQKTYRSQPLNTQNLLEIKLFDSENKLITEELLILFK